MGDPARWISVGELAEAFGPDNFTPSATADLAGATHVLNLEDGGSVEYAFMSEERLAWEVGGGEAEGARGEARYFAAKVRDGVYLVDFVAQRVPPTSVTLALDLGRGIATRIVGTLPDSADVGHSLMARITAGQELTAVTAAFSSAAVDAPFTADTPRHQPTGELVGRRVEYAYSPTERYEHIYLNEDFFTWHCLSGWEKGLGDTDRCRHFKLAEQLYLFVWREKIVPTLGVLAIDFSAMRTMGKIFGHAQGGSAGVVDFPVGARARLLNVTVHAPGHEKGMSS
jgi:MoaF C-terminal domain/MoaF N-terminal domain